MIQRMLKSEKRRLFFVALLWLVPIILYYLIQPFLAFGMPDGDVYLYHRLAVQLVQGQLPFVDYFFEYPPASVLVFVIPAFVITTAAEYVVVYQLLSWITLLVITFLVLKLHDIFEITSITRSRLFLYSSILCFLLIQLAVNRFDTFAAFFSILGTVLFIKGVQVNKIDYRTFGILALIFGTLVKLYPLFLLPFFGLYELKNRNWRALSIHACASILFSVPFIIWLSAGYQGLIFFLGYHSNRGLEIESSWASFVMLGHQTLGLFDYEVVYEYSSLGIRGVFPDILAHFSLYIFAGLLCFALAGFVIKLNSSNALWLLLNAAIFSLVGFATFNKVFSAQYIIWFIPLLLPYLGLLITKYQKSLKRIQPWTAAFALSLFVVVSTVIIFPYFWGWYVEGNVVLTLIISVRNLLLLVITGISLWELWPIELVFKKLKVKYSFKKISENN